MTRGWRIFWGAIAGMVLVLTLHPATRPLLQQSYRGFGPGQVITHSPWIASNVSTAPNATTPALAAYWVQLGVTRIEGLANAELSQQDRSRLLSVCKDYAAKEPNNAFWAQAVALISTSPAEAKEWWFRAARQATTWNDHQYARFREIRNELATADGGPLAWHSAFAISQRSSRLPNSISGLSYNLLFGAKDDPKELLRLQHASLVNGVWMRDSARTVSDLLVGVGQVEQVYDLAPRPAFGNPTSVRRTISARYDLIDRMRGAGMKQEAEQADQAFQGNDLRSGLDLQEVQNENRELALQAVISAKGAAVWVWTLVLAGLMAALGWGLRQVRIPAAGSDVVLISAALGGYLVHRVWNFPALTIGVVLAILLGLFRGGKRAPEHAHLSLVMHLLIVLGAGFATGVVGLTLVLGSTGNAALPHLNPYLDYVPGFGGVLLAMLLVVLLLCAHVAAWITRFPAQHLYALSLMRLGRVLTVVSVVGLTLFTPLSVYVDREIKGKLDKILINEPQYYLGHE